MRPSRDNPEQDPLAVLHLNNRLYKVDTENKNEYTSLKHQQYDEHTNSKHYAIYERTLRHLKMVGYQWAIIRHPVTILVIALKDLGA